MMPLSFGLALLSFVLTAAVLPPACALAARIGLLDHPGGRKVHEGAVPPVGGLALFPVFMALAAFTGQGGSESIWFYAALTLVLAVGGLDDRFSLPPRYKFAAQFAAALMITIPGHARVEGLGDLFGFGPVWLGPFAIPFSVIATVLLINAVNLMDGLDGLAGGIGIVILGWFAACAPETEDAAELLILCGALAGFLVHNMRSPWRARASVFLGDAGSLALGLAIAWYAMRLAGAADPAMEPAAAAWMLGLPIMDTCGQFARRVREGRHPFSADQNHFHHHFVLAGFSVGKAAAAIVAIVFLYGLTGVAGLAAGAPPWLMMYAWAALLLTHIYMSMRPARFRRLIARAARAGAKAG